MSKEKHPGLYIHFPFCRSKCLYCNFCSVASSVAIPDWVRAIQVEAFLYKGIFQTFDSLYLGGGTPSILGERDLATIMECFHKHFSFLPGSEITIEANPDGLSRNKLNTLKELSINRISIGVQSLDDKDLRYLGRSHDSRQALEALDTVRSAGFSNVGVDLMYGLTAQSISGWRKTLDRVLEFRPEHISCYQLSFEKGTPLWKMKESGKTASIGEKFESAFFIFTSRYLERHGYSHYEISNFARGDEFRSKHNSKYWRHSPYLGLGPSAHSFRGGKRWWNVRSIRKYCSLLSEGKAPVDGSEYLSREQLNLESLALGFRTRDGVELSSWPGTDPGAAVNELRRLGLAKVNKGMIQPTRRGFLVADSIPLMFCD